MISFTLWEEGDYVALRHIERDQIVASEIKNVDFANQEITLVHVSAYPNESSGIAGAEETKNFAEFLRIAKRGKTFMYTKDPDQLKHI